MISYNGYLDKYGMVTVNGVPGQPADNSENGLLFTAMAMYSQEQNRQPILFQFEELFNKCFIDGKLYRNPEPHPKPDSFDNYLGVVLGSLLENDSVPSRKLLISLIKHFGIINGESVGRFPQVWILLSIVGLPLMKYLLFPLVYGLYLLQNPKDAKNNTSGAQLQLTIVGILDILYPRMNFFTKWKNKLPCSLYEIFSTYYGENHPTTQLWKE